MPPVINLRRIVIYKDKLDVFYGGMADDPRIQKPEVFQISSHFDIWTYPKKLVPYRAMEAFFTDLTYSIIMFLYSSLGLFGLGVVSASSKVKIFKASDPLTGTWSALANGASAAGARFSKCFLEFHGYAYGGTASTRIWAADLTGSAAFTDTAYSGAGEPVCQGIVTSDDLLIIPCASGIAKKNGAGSGPTDAWSVFNIIPSGYTPTDICESGDFVIILAKTTSGVGDSKGFIWDKVSTDITDIIDFGNGDGLILDEIEGEVIAVSNVGGGSSFGIKPKMVIRAWAGGNKSKVIFELEADSGTSQLSIYGNHCKFKDGNRIVFAMKIILDGITYKQLFAIGRKTQNYPLAFTLDRLLNNDTPITGSIQGLLRLGNYVYASYNDDGSVNRTNDGDVFSNTTAIFITQKLTGERQVGEDARRKRKVLNMAGILCEALATGQVINLYYRVDATSAWTLIRTYSYGDDTIGMGFEAGTESDGSDFKNFKESQFKMTVTGTVTPTIPTAIIYSFNIEDADVQTN